MRVALSLLALLFCTPGNVWADAFLQTSFLNSDLSYGTGAPYQFGYDGESVRVNGNLWGECCAEFYEASGGVFVRQNVGRDAGGNVTSSEYLYEGGTFRIDFRLTNGGGANDVNGSFVAPIIGLRVLTSEPEGSPDAWYLLGPGVFDAPVAHALGDWNSTR